MAWHGHFGFEKIRQSPVLYFGRIVHTILAPKKFREHPALFPENCVQSVSMLAHFRRHFGSNGQRGGDKLLSATDDAPASPAYGYNEG